MGKVAQRLVWGSIWAAYVSIRATDYGIPGRGALGGENGGGACSGDADPEFRLHKS
jgi:hypothetical protein